LISLSVDSVPKIGLISASMGAFDATNSHNPFDPDPPYQSCCQLNSISGDEELWGESTRAGGAQRGDTQL